MIKETRGGGSVPPFYMEELQKAQVNGRVKCIVSEVTVIQVLESAVEVDLSGSVEQFDLIVSACGHRPDCTQLPLIQDLMKHSPCQITGGLPHLSQDLQWGQHKQMFAVGALASL